MGVNSPVLVVLVSFPNYRGIPTTGTHSGRVNSANTVWAGVDLCPFGAGRLLVAPAGAAGRRPAMSTGSNTDPPPQHTGRPQPRKKDPPRPENASVPCHVACADRRDRGAGARSPCRPAMAFLDPLRYRTRTPRAGSELMATSELARRALLAGPQEAGPSRGQRYCIRAHTRGNASKATNASDDDLRVA